MPSPSMKHQKSPGVVKTDFPLRSTSAIKVKVIIMLAINLVIYYLFLCFFGHDEGIGGVIFSIRLSCHEIRAYLFKGYRYNSIHYLSFQVGTLRGTSKNKYLSI